MQDERDRGRRAILNAGHTVAHAIESASDYRIHHGECVSIGLVIECRLAEAMGMAEAGTATAVARVLERFGLPLRLPDDLSPQAVLEAMAHDKKNRSGTIRFSFPKAIGQMQGTGGDWTVSSPPEMIFSVLSGESINIST